MSTKKTAVKKNVVKKPVAKKPVAKKAASAKKSAVKKPVAKKPAVKKPAAKPPSAKAKPVTAEPTVKRVPPRIIRKVPAAAMKPLEEDFEPIDTEKAVAFAASIAAEMKRSAAQSAKADELENQAVRLSRRPTTRAQGKETVQFSASDLRDFRRRQREQIIAADAELQKELGK